MAIDVHCAMQSRWVSFYGVSFTSALQRADLTAWDRALGDAAKVFRALADGRHRAHMVNMSGGFPTRYLRTYRPRRPMAW